MTELIIVTDANAASIMWICQTPHLITDVVRPSDAINGSKILFVSLANIADEHIESQRAEIAKRIMTTLFASPDSETAIISDNPALWYKQFLSVLPEPATNAITEQQPIDRSSFGFLRFSLSAGVCAGAYKITFIQRRIQPICGIAANDIWMIEDKPGVLEEIDPTLFGC